VADPHVHQGQGQADEPDRQAAGAHRGTRRCRQAAPASGQETAEGERPPREEHGRSLLAIGRIGPCRSLPPLFPRSPLLAARGRQRARPPPPGPPPPPGQRGPLPPGLRPLPAPLLLVPLVPRRVPPLVPPGRD